MATPEETVLELEKILERVSGMLKAILPSVKDPDVRKALKEAELMSRWKRGTVPAGEPGYQYAITRAKIRAKEHAEPFVVAEKADGTLVVIKKARLLSEKPYGLTEKEIVYEAVVETA